MVSGGFEPDTETRVVLALLRQPDECQLAAIRRP